MGILDRLRGGDEEGGVNDTAPPPVDDVRQLSRDGYSEEEITDILRDEGYSFGQINEALNQAVRQSVSGQGPQQPPQGQRRGPEGPWQGGNLSEAGTGPGPQEPPAQSGTGGPAPSQGPQPTAGGGGGGRGQMTGSQNVDVSGTGLSEEVEEMIEIIVKEHFTEVEDEFANVYAEIDELAARIDALRDEVKELTVREDEDEKEFIQKVDEIEEYIQQEQSQLGGMERAFEQVLPSLVQNVRELSELVKDMKQEQP